MRVSNAVHRLAAIALLPGLLMGCARRPVATPWAHVQEETPAFLGSSMAVDPSLAVDPSGHVALPWVTRDSLGADAWLTVSTDSGAHWSDPVRLNPEPRTVSSYPESRPVAAWGHDGMLVAAWSSKRPPRRGEGDDLA